VKSQYWKRGGSSITEQKALHTRARKLNEEPVSNHPGVQIDLAVPSEPIEPEPDAITTIRRMALLKCDIDHTLPDADIQLRALLKVCSTTELETAQQWNRVFTHYSSAVLRYRNQRNNKSSLTSKRDSEAIGAMQMRRNHFQYRQLSGGGA